MKEIHQAINLRVTRPTLLMLSHCVPSASGGHADRQRAWQLLDSFSRSHEVLLACLADGAVTLAQWRALHARTRQIVIEPVSLVRRWGSRVVREVSPRLSQSMLVRWKLERPVREWSASREIESVLCTRLSLMDAALMAGECERLVDHHADADLADARAARASAWIIRDPAQAPSLMASGARTILMPAALPQREGTSIRLVTDDADTPIALPQVALHKAA